MVLEMLINPRKAERTPWELFFLGLVYASVAVLLSMWIFQDDIGLVMVFLTVLACTYLVQGTLRLEEKKDERIRSEATRLREHTKALSFMMFLFLGFTVAFSLWYILMPNTMVSKVFSTQIETISSINAQLAEEYSGHAIAARTLFARIFFNNTKVLFFSFIFAFFYGAGAMFILAWNAAVVGTAIGSFVRSGLAAIAQDIGFIGIGSYLSTYSLGILRYMTHGWLEILAYFTVALAGGIISVAVLRHSVRSQEFRRALIDSAHLAAISMVMLIIAAGIEVYVTPALF
ncbi:stage II sporulation protein M [Candidatus Woesearchaeota archaeon]|nr:stage II sporulation protein M [Candidatus Woesearchaeota archaeon]